MVVFITHFLNIVFTRFGIFCRNAENDQVMKKVLRVGERSYFSMKKSTAFSMKKRQKEDIEKGGGEGRKGKNQKKN